MAAFELRQHAAGIGQAEVLEGTIGQHAAPAVKHHHRLGTGFDLGIQIEGHGVGIDRQDAVHQVRAAVHQAFHQTVVVRATAFHHVASQRPRAARKTNQRHTALQSFANGGDRVKHILQLVHIGHGQGGHGRFVAHHFGKLRPFALGKRQTQAHGVRDGQDVRKQNRRIQRIAVQRLQGHFGGVVHVGGQPHETAGLGAGGAVLGQVASSLAHQPNGGVVGGLTQAGFEEGVVEEWCVHKAYCGRAWGAVDTGSSR